MTNDTSALTRPQVGFIGGMLAAAAGLSAVLYWLTLSASHVALVVR